MLDENGEPNGDDVSLTGMVGVMVLAGHCNAFPTATYDEVMADAGNNFVNVWNYAESPYLGLRSSNARYQRNYC